jgi:predicted porin
VDKRIKVWNTTSVVGAAAMLLSASAMAQSSVTIYGIMDNGVEALSGAPDSKGHSSSLVRAESGGVNSSRIGFRGSEDLGGGLKAIFTLEGGLDTTDGKSLQNGRLFGRQSWMGLSSNYGDLTFGRQRIPMYNYGAKFDPLDYYNYGLKETDSQFSGRADNSVMYKGLYNTGSFGSFSLEALYSTGYDATITDGGQVAGAFKVGREISIGAGYIFGPFAAAVTYDERNGTSIGTQGQKEQHIFAATSLKLGAAKLFAGYRWLDSDLALTSATQGHANEYYGGIRYQVSAPVSVAAAAYYTDITSADQHPLYLVVSAAYALSKRTQLYGEAGYVKNNNGSNLGVNGYDSDVVAGHNQTGVIAGVIHYF